MRMQHERLIFQTQQYRKYLNYTLKKQKLLKKLIIFEWIYKHCNWIRTGQMKNIIRTLSIKETYLAPAI